MTIHKRKKNETVNKDEWFEIAITIAKSFKYARNAWIKIFLAFMSDKISDLEKMKLDGKGEICVKAYQILSFSEIMAKTQYVSPKDGKSFADLIFSQVCGDKIEECLEYFDRYYKVFDDAAARFFRLTNDLIKYYTGEEGSFEKCTITAHAIPVLDVMTRQAVAYAFNDQKMYNKLQNQTDKLLTKMGF